MRSQRTLRLTVALLLFAFAVVLQAHGDDARFDLAGPQVSVSVTRGTVTLPIAQVPSLLANDRLNVRADLPKTQSNHLVVVVAFLRGATNEPPDDWFTRIDPWKLKTGDWTTIAVPAGAENVVLFLAPETGGDFGTLRGAVKRNPGLFQRAVATLNKASLQQQRIQRYLSEMQPVANDDETPIKLRSDKLAAALALTPNGECFSKPVAEQLDCLTQQSENLLLDDGHGQTIADAISTGASSDFINEAAQSDGGTYSAYVGTLIDLIHLVGSLHTAQYRYIPAISFPEGAALNLRLNASPSFNNPKSVIVVALPMIGTSDVAHFRFSPSALSFCLRNPNAFIPLTGVPNLFVTAYAHNLQLVMRSPAADAHLPLKLDALAGGLVPTDAIAHPTGASDEQAAASSALLISGRLEGQWGFDSFQGPPVLLQPRPSLSWHLEGSDTITAGVDSSLTLQSDGASCIQSITLSGGNLHDTALTYSSVDANHVHMQLPLKDEPSGDYTLKVRQYGLTTPQRVSFKAYASRPSFSAVLLGTDPDRAVLVGKDVTGVVSVRIGSTTYAPEPAASEDASVQLHASDAPGAVDAAIGTVTLSDGRLMDVPVRQENAGAKLTLLSLQAVEKVQDDNVSIELGAADDISLHSMLHFVVQSSGPFPRTQRIEVATSDGSPNVSLSISANTLILEDRNTAVAHLDLDEAFGESAFGELRFRSVPGDGTYGSWIKLGRLVRRPRITSIICTANGKPVCLLKGSELFLVKAFSSTPDFAHAVTVPAGFDGQRFAVPRLSSQRGEAVYVQLRDDPGSVAVFRPTRRPESYSSPMVDLGHPGQP